MSNIKNEIGNRYGRLTVLRKAGVAKDRHVLWECHCACGGVTTTKGRYLRNGDTRSCGCLDRETSRVSGRQNRTHGKARSSTYRSWRSMWARTTNPNAPDYERYGGRGIKVCERWKTFENFYLDMGDRPHDHSLDRMDNDGDYTPNNCKWSSRTEQQRNRRGNVTVTLDGESMCLAEACEKRGMPYRLVSQRVSAGWSLEKALTQPPRKWTRQTIG